MDIEGVRLHFVYSFAFSHLPLREPIRTNNGRSVNHLGDYLTEELWNQGPTYYQEGRVHWHTSEETEPPVSRAALFAHFPHLSIATKEEFVEFTTLGRGRISTNLALFESGMGVMWILVIPEVPPQEDVLSLAACRGSQPGVSPTNADFGITRRAKSLHEIFQDKVEILKNHINNALNNLHCDTQAKLLAKYPSLHLKHSPEQPEPPSSVSPASPFEVSWLDKSLDENCQLLWSDGDTFEEPSVAIILKVSQIDRDGLDLPADQDRRKAVERTISQLLHTISADNLDSSHSSEHRDNRLVNLYPDRRFRTFVHGNCLLVLHSEDTEGKDFTDFTKGLFRIYCGLRGCWHIYSIVNEQLDQSIAYLLAQVRGLRGSDTSHDARMIEKLEEIILIKGYFLSALAAEDPLDWGVRLTPFGPLDQVGREIFCLANLRNRIEYKLGELDKLYEMVSSYEIRAGLFPNSVKVSKWYWLKSLLGCGLLFGFYLTQGWLSPYLVSPIFQGVSYLLLLLGAVLLLVPLKNS